jgi:hypothetical protein
MGGSRNLSMGLGAVLGFFNNECCRSDSRGTAQSEVLRRGCISWITTRRHFRSRCFYRLA